MPSVNYLWDPVEDNVIGEFDDEGNLLVEYTTEPELHGDVISQRRDGETNCFYSDGLGSTTEVTNAGGDTIATRAYSAFGGTTESTGDVVFPYQYIGQKGYYLDSETSTYYIRRRPFNPTIGRFMSADVLSFAAGRSRYSYVHNRPITSIDPSGLVDIYQLKNLNKKNGLCGAYELGASFIPRPRGDVTHPLVIVWKITVTLKISYCDSCKASAKECPTVVCEDEYEDCVYYEFGERYTGEEGEGLLVGDREKPPNRVNYHVYNEPVSFPGKCPNTMGESRLSYTIRLFEDPKDVIFEEARKWGGAWCFNQYSRLYVNPNPTSTKATFWDTGKVVDEGNMEGIVIWDCCKDPASQVARLAAKGDYGYRSDELVLYYNQSYAEKKPMIFGNIERPKGGKCGRIILGDPG